MYSIKQLIDYKYIGDVLSLAILRISLAVVFRCFTEQDWVEKKKNPQKTTEKALATVQTPYSSHQQIAGTYYVGCNEDGEERIPGYLVS